MSRRERDDPPLWHYGPAFVALAALVGQVTLILTTARPSVRSVPPAEETRSRSLRRRAPNVPRNFCGSGADDVVSLTVVLSMFTSLCASGMHEIAWTMLVPYLVVSTVAVTHDVVGLFVG